MIKEYSPQEQVITPPCAGWKEKEIFLAGVKLHPDSEYMRAGIIPKLDENGNLAVSEKMQIFTYIELLDAPMLDIRIKNCYEIRGVDPMPKDALKDILLLAGTKKEFERLNRKYAGMQE